MTWLPIKEWNGAALVSRFKTRWPEFVYGALLVAILAVAASLRFSVPQTPLMDADTWGYLNPAFSKLTGGYFQHTFGRNFVYPSFLFVLLCGWGNYEVVTLCQHLLGLLGGVCLALTWNLLCGFMKLPLRAAFGVRLLGLGLVALYLFSRPQYILEHTIRPESVFPFFLVLSFLLNFSALRAWFVASDQRRVGWFLGANLFVTYLGMSLKPSMGFGAAAANLPLLWWLWRGASSWRWKAVVTGTALTVTLLTLWLPEKLLAEKDRFTLFFLPTMLFTIHAPSVHEQIVEDLRTGNTAPYPHDWLENFNQGLERSFAGAQAHNAWRLLGFNADHLIYQDSIFDGPFADRGDDRERAIADFCMHYYWRTWRHRPLEMFGKIGRQLRFVYVRYGAFKFRRWMLNDPYTGKLQRPMSHDYTISTQCTENPGIYPRLLTSRYGSNYVRHVNQLQKTKKLFRQYLVVGYLNNLLLPTLYLPLLFAAVAAGVALLSRDRSEHALLVGGVFLCIVVNFGLFLTVAVAHTLEITRYVDNQTVLILLTEFAAVLLPVQWWFSRRQNRTAATADALPAPDAVTPQPLAMPRLP